MRRRELIIGGLVALPATGSLVFWTMQSRAVAGPPKIADADYAAIRSAVNPAKGEDPFTEIPWQTSLWDARKLAAKEGKPILLWEMDGHPLGCG